MSLEHAKIRSEIAVAKQESQDLAIAAMGLRLTIQDEWGPWRDLDRIDHIKIRRLFGEYYKTIERIKELSKKVSDLEAELDG